MVTSPASPNAPRFFVGKNEKQPIVPMPPDGRAAIARADRLRGIFDDRNAGTRGNVDNRRHVGALAEQVHRQDRFRLRRESGRDGSGVDIERGGIDVDKHRTRSHPGDRAGRREERKRSRHDLVARTDVQGHQGGKERIRARRNANGVRDSKKRFELALEGFNLGTEDEVLRIADARDRVEHALAERRELCLEVDQRDFLARHKH